jgi:ParB family chromosome partitioning protein
MESGIRPLSIDSIFPNPGQPRKDFDQGKLEELSGSIRQYGVLEPIVVTPREGRFMIIAGERRYRASLLAGLPDIPARVIEADDALVEELSLLENIQREDLNIVEEAEAYRRLLDRGWSREELARKMGFKQTWRIDERLSLLNLIPEHRDLVIKGVIGNSQAFEMSRLSPPNQEVLLRKLRAGELGSYNRLRAFVDGLLMLERQGSVFELKTLSPQEARSVRELEATVRSVERFLKEAHLRHLSKAAFHTDVTVERIDLVIRGLQKVRKSILAGAGAKEAVEAA